MKRGVFAYGDGRRDTYGGSHWEEMKVEAARGYIVQKFFIAEGGKLYNLACMLYLIQRRVALLMSEGRN